jgi:DNA repair protein RadC
MKKYTKIQNMPLFERPREKLKKMGPRYLSERELIAVLLGSGTRKKDVFRLAAELACKIHDDVECVKRTDELQQIRGIGPVKAAQITAAFELSQRYLAMERRPITCPENLLPLVEDLAWKKQEFFITVSVDGASCLIKKRVVFIGTLNQSLVHPREVFAYAITDRAKGIFLIHNHPSGNCKPSAEDLEVTKRLVEAGEIIGIEVIDHLILGKTEYFSFTENKLL